MLTVVVALAVFAVVGGALVAAFRRRGASQADSLGRDGYSESYSHGFVSDGGSYGEGGSRSDDCSTGGDTSDSGDSGGGCDAGGGDSGGGDGGGGGSD